MLDWVARHHQVLSVLTSIGMLFVWIAYLQVFIGNYRRQTRPKILINRGAGSGLQSRCLVSNMSSDAIYIRSIIASIEAKDERWTCPVTELEDLEEWQSPTDLNLWSRQGPLQAGHVRDMGTFRKLLDHVLASRGPAGALDELLPMVLELQVIAVYGSEDLLVGAKRRFDIIAGESAPLFKAQTVDTVQIRSRQERRKIEELLAQEL